MLFMAGISTVTVWQYFQTFFEKKERTAVVYSILGAYFLWQMMSMQGMPTFPSWLRLLISVGAVVIIGYSVNGSWFQKIVFAIIYNAIWMLSELLAGCFLLVFEIDYASQNLFGSMVSKLFLLIFVKLLQRFFSHDAVRELSWYYNVMLMSLPMGSMFIAYHLFMVSSKIEEVKYVRVSLLLFVVILIVNIMMFQIYIRLSDNLELKRKNSIYQLEIDLYNEHIKEKESTMLEFRRAKHDMKHQIIYLLELSENKEYKKLDEHLKNLIEWEPLEGVTIANTDNLMIDALTNCKYSIAKRKGISFRINLEIPTSLPFEDADLCVVLGNALDNAIEACLRGKVSDPYIDLKIKYDLGNLIVIVENPYDGKIKKNNKGKILTRKDTSPKHGIGMNSMERIVDKYHGFFGVETNDNIFRLKIILYSDTNKND